MAELKQQGLDQSDLKYQAWSDVYVKLISCNVGADAGPVPAT